MQGLSGLAGLNAQPRLIEEAAQNQATPEEISGGPADPRHGKWGEIVHQYPWQSTMTPAGSHGPYGLENALLDDDYWWLTPPGTPDQDPMMDRTPYRTHGGPHPQGILSGPIPGELPDDVGRQRWQSMVLHGIKTNAGVRALVSPQAIGIQNDQWSDFWVMNPGETMLEPLSRQQMSSHFMFGSRDRTQTMSPQNGYDFDASHMHRRYATGPIPGNTMWMKPGGRVLVKNIPTVARAAIGIDSPFNGDDIFANYALPGAMLLNTPTEYVPPAQPKLAANPADAPLGDSGAIVEWW